MKGRQILIVSILVLVVVVVCCTLCYHGASESVHCIEYATVVVDAGHGGKDGGVVGSDGTLESELNLSIARRVAERLVKRGVRVVMTRKDESALGDTKKKDMAERARIIREADADIVVSIHINKYSDDRRRGVQVFYDDTARWKREGIYMQNIMNEYINKVYSGRHDLIALGGDYFMTKCADVPSLIVECGFISNIEDERLLHDKTYIYSLAKYICIGIESILMT